MIKCKDGRRTCTHACATLDYEFGADTINKSLAIVDSQDRTIAHVAYVRGLDNHPLRGQSELLTELETSYA